jgi:CRISPR/Cas system CMR-associated protein Cmr5 small subunit
MLFHLIREDLRSYLALHKSLLLAGFSKQEIKNLLNEPIKQNYDSWTAATPLMIALRGKHDLLAAQLMADGAELTASQKQQVEQHQLEVERNTKKHQKTEDTVVPLNKAAIKEELQKTEKSIHKKPKLERRAPLSDFSLFAEKQSAAHYKNSI